MRTWQEAIRDPLYEVWMQEACMDFERGFRDGWLDRVNGYCSMVSRLWGGNYSHGYAMGQRAHEVECLWDGVKKTTYHVKKVTKGEPNDSERADF